MALLRKNDLSIPETEEGPEDVEDSLIKDSVLEMVSSSVNDLDRNDDIPVGSIRRNVPSFDELSGKPVSREKYFKEQWASENDNLDVGGTDENNDEDEIVESDEDETEDEDGTEDSEENMAEGNHGYVSGRNKDESEVNIGSDSDCETKEVEELSGSESETDDELGRPSKKVKRENSHTISLYSAAARDVMFDVEKGKAVRNQMAIWENLLECRIKLQRALSASNKLYQFQNFKEFKSTLSSEEQQNLAKTYAGLVNLLESLLEFQKLLAASSSDVGEVKNNMVETMETGVTVGENNTDGMNSNQKLLKYSEILEKSLQSLKAFRDPVIQKWNDKTRILSGKISRSDFSVFEQSTLKQIEQILCDRTRLVQRTQLKRSHYHILGKQKEQPPVEEDEIEDQLKIESKTDEYDAEIFDDDDFYHKLLRDFIEKKASDVTDPHQLGRQWTELQKLRSKMKRKIDTRATKGRKLRYTVHNKIVNFMAPVPYATWTDEAESELFKSLFGNSNTNT